MTIISKSGHLRRIIGSVSPDERNEIQTLFERKNALAELLKALPDIPKEKQVELYERLVADMANTNSKFQKWWAEKSTQYRWEASATGWHIDFDTCEIFLEDSVE